MPDDPTAWRNSLAAWQISERASPPPGAVEDLPTVPLGWWEAAFAKRDTPSEQRGHKCGDRQMLTIVAYDVSDPRRLRNVARICEDNGMRVQYSVFECRLEAGHFDRFWHDLSLAIDPDADRLVAYKVCASCARDIRGAGAQTHQEKVIAYVF